MALEHYHSFGTSRFENVRAGSLVPMLQIAEEKVKSWRLHPHIIAKIYAFHGFSESFDYGSLLSGMASTTLTGEGGF